MTNDNLTVLILLALCLIGAVVAIRYQYHRDFVRRDYRKPNASAQQAGTTPPSRPDQIGAPRLLTNDTARQRERSPAGHRPRSHP